MTNVLPNIKKMLTVAGNSAADVFVYAESRREVETSDFSIWSVDITVGEACESGVNDSKYFTVDLETGILIIEAARKIIASRVMALNAQEPE